jgi:hypothetical protein
VTATKTLTSERFNVAKRKPSKEPTPEPAKVVIYLEVDPYLKTQLERFAKLHNRKLTGECVTALQEYLAKLGAWPPPEQN